MTGAASVQFNVTFSESVTGVDATDFALAVSGVTGASISSVTGSGAAYVITVNTGSGDGTLGLNLADNDTIADVAANKLGGAGSGNGDFTGQVYTIAKADPVFTGVASADNFYLRRNGTLAEVFAAATPTGSPIWSTTFTNLQSITFATGGGDDAVYIDNAGGTPIPATSGIFYNGSTGANALTISGAAASAGTITLTGGAVLLTAASGVAANLAVVVNSGAILSLNSSQKLARLSLAGGNANVSAGGAKVLDLGVLEIASPSKLDLADNDMIVRSTSAGTVENFIRDAYDFGGWSGGSGLRTSMSAATTGLTTLGIARAGDLLGIAAGETADWNGQVVNDSSVLVKYTYSGDANLDGTIDGGDYGILDNYVQVPGASGYWFGDFNFDGVIDGGDYGIIDNNIQAQGVML
jgi:hypothetical protein